MEVKVGTRKVVPEEVATNRQKQSCTQSKQRRQSLSMFIRRSSNGMSEEVIGGELTNSRRSMGMWMLLIHSM